MAWIRQLPSGLWAATVYTPEGRITESHRLKGRVEDWAGRLEEDIRRGEFIDPRHSTKLLAEVWERFAGSRRVEKATRARDESHWKCWVAPRWGATPIGAILKPDVQTWVNELEEREVGGWTIIAGLNVLKAALELAVDAGWLRSNPARRVKPPVPPEHVDRVIQPEEEALILDRLDELFPGRRDARPFVETKLETAGRWEEIAAIRPEAVNLSRLLIKLGPVMERDGTVREYPKGARSRHSAGFRDAPISSELGARLRPLVLATPPGGLVFTAPQGGPMLYPTWLRRVWNATLRVPVLDDNGEKTGDWTPLVAEPLPTPHDCRHTTLTRYAEAGLELHERMALGGHKDVRSSMRYANPADSRFDRARAALRQARGS